MGPCDGAVRLTPGDPAAMLSLVRVRPETRLLLASLVVWSGICVCLGGVLDLRAPQNSHCGSEPTPVSDHERAGCEPSCSAVPALQLRSDWQPTETSPGSIQPAGCDLAAMPVQGWSSPHPDGHSLVGHTSRNPLYVWQSALLI